MSESTQRIPALVISGFLGSGKTSLVRHLLEDAQRQGLRVAFISNELGALGVDRALLGGGGDAFVELEGGCVCCELSDDLVNTMQMLYEQVAPDRIVIETAGVALPWDTQLNFWREPVSAWVGDDATLVVVNAEQLRDGRDLEGTFADQVSSADLLILNKVDLVPEDELEALEATLRELEPESPIVRAVHGRVETNLLFPPDAACIDRSGAPPESAPHHHEAFESEIWAAPAGISGADLAAKLDDERLLRAKGFVETDAGLRLVQLVGRRLEVSEPDTPVDDAMRNLVVLIRRA